MTEAKAKEGEFEICVICKNITKMRKTIPIEMRKHYIDGCGQLCEHCFEKVSGKKARNFKG